MSEKVVLCPHCRNKVEVLSQWQNMELLCPVCGQKFVLDHNTFSGKYNSIDPECMPGKTAEDELPDMFTALRKYAVFDGRASRREYWLFNIFQNLLQLAGTILCLVLVPVCGSSGLILCGMVMMLFMLALLIPNLAVTVRRCHDTGKSGWWMLISLIPCLGPLLFLITMCSASEKQTNRYGPDPNGNHPDEVWPVAVGILLSFITPLLFQTIA